MNKLFNDAIDKVSGAFEVTRGDLFSPSRKAVIVKARYLLYYLCSEGGLSPSDIAFYMKKGGRNTHMTTVSYGIKKVNQNKEQLLKFIQ